MNVIRLAELREEPLSVDEVYAAVTDPAAGGIAVFAGTVRDHDDGRSVTELSYSAHPSAADELRRVARKRIVIVVPRQRPYAATFNQHIHFFPYEFSLLAWTGTSRPHTLDLVGGDWLYIEDCVAG